MPRDVFQNPNAWFAVEVKPRNERLVAAALETKEGMESGLDGCRVASRLIVSVTLVIRSVANEVFKSRAERIEPVGFKAREAVLGEQL